MVNESYLQMIQSVIARQATQSTAVKAWCVTLTAALLGFGVKTDMGMAALIAFYVIVTFAVLDAYYLCLERAYRALFRQAADGDAADWSLAIPRPRRAEVGRALASPSIALIYGSSLVAIAGIGLYDAIAG